MPVILPDILYEDKELIVCRKPAGLAVQNASVGRMDLESLLRNHLARRGGPGPYLGVVHRLDQPVQGLLVFAKTKRAAADLSVQVQNGRMEKEYLAVLCGHLPARQGTLTHFLKKQAAGNLSLVVSEKTAGAKKAVLDYEVCREDGPFSLVRIRLHTGRHHQIRVQLAAAGAPLYGDTKYNPQAQPGEKLALCAHRISFLHPSDGRRLEFTCTPEGFPLNMQEP